MNQYISRLPYIIASLMLAIWVFFSYFYYGNQAFDRSYVMLYIILLVIFFGGYKFFQSFWEIKSYRVSPLLLVTVFFIHLLVLCMVFAGISGENFLLGISFWFFLTMKLLAVALLWILIYLSGKAIIDYLEIFTDWSSKISRVLASLTLGFLLIVMLLFTLLSVGLYNIYGLVWVIGILSLLSYPHIRNFYDTLLEPVVVQNLRSREWYIKSIIDDANYVILTLFLWVNFISAYRPYPIGWDDLGAYMNYPKLFSSTGELISMGNMYAWEIYTGIWFLLGSQTSAFLLNSFSGIIVCIVLFLGFSSFKKWESPSTFSYPLLWVLTLMVLPMTVFQLAKDMKLDYGLLFMSASTIFIMLQALYYDTKEDYTWKFWVFVGLLMWFCFSIKVTSLLLILSLVVLLAYRKWWVYLYFSMVFIIISLFSIAGLWWMLNVIFPTDIETRFSYGIITLVLWIFFGVFAWKKYSSVWILDFCRIVAYIFLWCIIALLPWFSKNISETTQAWESLSIGRLIGWVSERFQPDYSVIYSESEIAELREVGRRGISATGTTSNEDFWRYIWYEEGINNYLKLPWNLTFQVNQWWEFTNITYLFFILLPVFLFVFVYKKTYVPLVFVWLGIFSLLYFIPEHPEAWSQMNLNFIQSVAILWDLEASIFLKIIIVITVIGEYLLSLVWLLWLVSYSNELTSLFSTFTLPYGYIWVFVWYFLIFIIAEVYIDKEKNSYADIFLALLAFWSLYVFLWVISSFGIVWYGIVMYPIFLGLIVVWLYQSEENNFWYMPYLALAWVWIFIIFSGLAHATDNLAKAWYLDYKLGEISENEAILRYHPEYFEFLFAFNLSDAWQDRVLTTAKDGLMQIFSQYTDGESIMEALLKISNPEELRNILQLFDAQIFTPQQEKEYRLVKQKLFNSIIGPSDDIKSTANIYRLGTFMTYFMVDNNTRVWSDGLINQFDSYLWDDDQALISSRLVDLWVQYMIFDLNAATIDEDPRRDLTRRYENLLRYSLSSEVEYIAWDSICFRLARDLHAIWAIAFENALSIAGTNYGTIEERKTKLSDCITTLYEAIEQEIYERDPDFSYLLVYKNMLDQIETLLIENNIEVTKQTLLSQFSRNIGRWYKILLRIPE